MFTQFGLQSNERRNLEMFSRWTYRTVKTDIPKGNIIKAEVIMTFMWYWILFHLWYDIGHVTVNLPCFYVTLTFGSLYYGASHFYNVYSKFFITVTCIMANVLLYHYITINFMQLYSMPIVIIRVRHSSLCIGSHDGSLPQRAPYEKGCITSACP